MLICYLILGIDINASDSEIRTRYLELVKVYPPETSGGVFETITIAYESIKDKRSRVKTRVFGLSEVVGYEDLIKGLTIPLKITRRSPLLSEIIDAEKKGVKR